MTERSFHLDMPYILPDQAQKHVTVNQTFDSLDDLVFLSVLDKNISTPPALPDEGDRYIIGGNPTGEWAQKSAMIASFRDGAWIFYTPFVGWRAWNTKDKELLVFEDGEWTSVIDTINQFQNLSQLGIGTQADLTNPFSAKLNAALWTALPSGEGGTGNLRYTFNKEDTDNVLSLLFQSNWQGRAEIGLVGNDDLSFRVSSDGVSFTEAMRLDPANATVHFANGMQTTTINNGSLGGFRNYIVNGGFDCWQRGTTLVAQTAKNFLPDRWYLWSTGGATTYDVSRQVGESNIAKWCARIQRSNASLGTGNLHLCQVIDPDQMWNLLDQPVTVSFRARKGVNFSASSDSLKILLRQSTDPLATQNSGGGFSTSAIVNAINLDVPLTSTWQTFSASGTIDPAARIAALIFSYAPIGTASPDDYFEIENIQLETGNLETMFERRPIGIEQMLCNYFFQRRAVFVADTESNLGLINMRVTPTISGGGTGFSAANTSKEVLIASQTSAALQTLNLDSEL